jgi:hypothetical protein
VWGRYALIALVFSVLVVGYLGYQNPTPDSCRAMTQSHNDLPLTGNNKTPSLSLSYYQFRLIPCYRKIRAELAAAQESQKEESRRHDAEKAEAGRRKAILEDPRTVFPNQAAAAVAEAESEKVLARLQQTEPCRSKLAVEAKGRADFSKLSVQDQRSLSDLIVENAKNCR